MIHRCFRMAAVAFCLTNAPLGWGGPISSLDDVEFWVGEGTNRAALVLDWYSDSSLDESLVWGYRWDGAATGEDMLRDILAADERLFAKLSTSSLAGIATYGFGYDTNDDNAFAIDDGTVFSSDGIHVGEPADGAVSTDPNDFYAEGWYLGFWHIATATVNPFDGGSWAGSSSGVSSINLVNDFWTGIAFYPYPPFPPDPELPPSTEAFAENPHAAAGPAVSANFDEDLDVDGADFLIWQRGFGKLETAALQDGDANDDQNVDQLDYQIWEQQFGSFQAALAFSTFTTTIPEPTTFALLASAVMFVIALRRIHLTLN